MEFNEEGLWDWSTQKEQGNEVHEEPITPPPSPIASTPIHESLSSSSLLEGSYSERPRKMRSLQDLYDSTEITNGVTLFYLFADCEPTRFEEAVQDKKWRNAMDKEIKAIKKNDTWELQLFQLERRQLV